MHYNMLAVIVYCLNGEVCLAPLGSCAFVPDQIETLSQVGTSSYMAYAMRKEFQSG